MNDEQNPSPPIPSTVQPDGPEPLPDLVAYLDGELDGQARQAVEVKLSQDAAARAEAQSLRKVWDLLDYLPQPVTSPTFTERTMERLAPLTVSAPPPPESTPSAPITSQAELLPVRGGLQIKWVAMGTLALVAFVWLGYLGFAALTPPPPRVLKDPDALSLADLRVVENLGWYQHIDTFEYLLQLEASQLFEESNSP